MTNVAHQFLLKVFDRREDPSSDDIALNLGEPELDLVQPGRVRRRKMQTHRRVRLQKLGHPLGLVRREIVRNHMDLLARGLMGHEVRQERDELLGGVAVGCLAQDLARLGIERGIEGERAVSVVFEPMPVPPVPATRAAPDPCGPRPGSRFSHPHKTPPHAAGGSDRGR